MQTVAVQFLEPCSGLVDYPPEKVREKLKTAFSILPISILIIGWDIPDYLVEICVHEAQPVNAKLYRWQPLLTSDGKFPVREEYRVIGLIGKPVPGYLGMPEFSFMCPNNPAYQNELSEHLDMLFKGGIYDGVFLDRMRFPALSGDAAANFGCFCRHCGLKAEKIGLDLSLLQKQILDLLIDAEGVYQFLQVILQPGKKEFLTKELEQLNKFLSLRKDSITRILRLAAESARENGWEVGLDCFSPILANSVGQDLPALDGICDWIKPMTYLHTFAPAGLPFELNGMLDLIQSVNKEDRKSSANWLARISDLSIPASRQRLVENGLPASVWPTEIARIKDQVSSPIYAGIEMVAVENVTNIDPSQLEKDIRVLKETSADGIVVSWDLWHIKEESLRILARTLSAE
jgi:hypothetical protein